MCGVDLLGGDQTGSLPTGWCRVEREVSDPRNRTVDVVLAPVERVLGALQSPARKLFQMSHELWRELLEVRERPEENFELVGDIERRRLVPVIAKGSVRKIGIRIGSEQLAPQISGLLLPIRRTPVRLPGEPFHVTSRQAHATVARLA